MRQPGADPAEAWWWAADAQPGSEPDEKVPKPREAGGMATTKGSSEPTVQIRNGSEKSIFATIALRLAHPRRLFEDRGPRFTAAAAGPVPFYKPANAQVFDAKDVDEDAS